MYKDKDIVEYYSYSSNCQRFNEVKNSHAFIQVRFNSC